jgi:hypothetical protein
MYEGLANKPSNDGKKPLYKNWGFWIIVIVLFIAMNMSLYAFNELYKDRNYYMNVIKLVKLGKGPNGESVEGITANTACSSVIILAENAIRNLTNKPGSNIQVS